MSTIVTRLGKGTALTWEEADANFTNLNTDKLEASDLSVSTGSSLIGFTQSGANATLRTAQDKMREKVTAQDVGAVGDGVTNDSTAFTKLETDHPGKPIDLLGKQYLVSAIPIGCQYFNGDFIVGSTRVSLRRKPLDNPIDGNSWIAFGDGLTHYWLFGFVYIEASGKLLAFVKAAYRHGTSDSSPLNVITSDDRGATWKDEQTIHAVAGFDISHAACGIMGSNRIGVVTYVKDLDTAAYRNDFIYSDDGGVTWSTNTNIVSGLSLFTYGDLISYPTIVGGNDTIGFAVYGYASGVRVAKTVDNGATWSSATISGLGSQFSEPSVVRVNSESKWIMFLRDDGANLFVSTSTDMLVWTAPVDTGFALESNPVYAYVANGSLFVYCMLRDYTTPTGGKENQILCFEENPSVVYAASTLVNKAPRAIGDGIERSTGYICIRPVGQDFVWGYTSAEDTGSTNSSGASSIVFGSTRRVPMVGIGFAQSMAENPNLLRNPTFELWSRGTSFPGLTVATKTADGWSYIPSGATATVSRVELTAEQSNLFPFNPHYGYSFITSVADNFAGMYQQLNGKEELFRFSEQHVTFQIWGIGDVPQETGSLLPRMGVTFNYGGGGSTTITNVEFIRFVESAGNMWKGIITVIAPTVLGKTIGTSPYVRIQFDSQSTLAWSATICGIKAEFGQYPTKFSPVDYIQDKIICERYVQRLDVPGIDSLCMVAGQSTTSAFGIQPYPDMVADPIISIITGTAADYEMYPSGTAISAMSWSNIGKRAATLTVTTSGLVAAGSYAVRSKTGTTSAILLDAE